jgi:hypothetical protein
MSIWALAWGEWVGREEGADLRESAAAIRKGWLASKNCGDTGLGIDDAAEGKAGEALFMRAKLNY